MDPQIRARVPFLFVNLATSYKKENCKGIDYFNRGEIKTKLLSWANRGTTKCTLSANDWEREAISHDKERKSKEDVGGLQEIAYKVTRASF
jgi:hypothetical protein